MMSTGVVAATSRLLTAFACQSRLLTGKPRASTTEKRMWLMPAANNLTLLMPTAGNPRWYASNAGSVNYFTLNKSIMRCSSAAEIEAFVMNNPKMNDVNIATAYRALIKCRSTNMLVYKKLGTLSAPISFRARELSSILHSIASSRQFAEIPEVFMQKLGEVDLAEFPPQSISNTMWAFAKMNSKNNAFFESVAVDVQTRDLKQFNDQAIANVLWSCAKLDFKNNAMLARLARHLTMPNLSAFTPQAIGNILWALAKLEYKDDALLASFAQDLTTRDISTFTPQAIANITCAFATLGNKNDVLLARCAQDLTIRNLSTLTPQAVANIAWALAKLEYKDDAMLARFAQDLTTRNLSTFTPQTISNIAWAFATMRMSAPAMFQRFADAVLFTSPQLAVSKMNSQDMANLLYACALVDYRNDVLFSKLAHELSFRESLPLQVVTNSMWAFACLDALNLKEVKLWFSKPTNEQRDFLPVHAGQLFQVKLAWQQTHGDSLPALIENLCKGGRVNAALLAADEKEPESSHVHLRIAKMLEKNFTLQNEAQLLGGVSVDIFIPEHNAVVEVDGPLHFFSNQPDVKTGATVFKHRLLERAGYKLISLPVHEYVNVGAEQCVKDLERRITE